MNSQNKKVKVIFVRVTEEEKEWITAQAKSECRSVSSFMSYAAKKFIEGKYPMLTREDNKAA